MPSSPPFTIAERQGVISACLDEPPPSTPSQRVANRLVDLCRDIEARLEVSTVLVLTSAGPTFWIREPTSPAEHDAASTVWSEAIDAVAQLAIPTVAVLGSDAIGPAWELALACDLRLAVASARVGDTAVLHGSMPRNGGTQRLTRLVGPARAAELLLLGEVMPAPLALERGLVHHVAEDGDLETALERLLQPMRAAAPLALRYVKEAVRDGMELSLAAGLRLEADLATLLQTTADRAEGITSFLERRPAHFTGQ